jgi:hypothetical protein
MLERPLSGAVRGIDIGDARRGALVPGAIVADVGPELTKLVLVVWRGWQRS